ncbi:ATP-binding cassette domain-containing protein [Bacillus subtilis]|uniref:ATP-binding cassette domain-containing protein n=1 Tax=Bacillus subtilis TaxID=1423 RepID=UPI002545FFCF|nr:ATP-binding cassette domain-containing protein [Bacillus subtilis]
MKGVSKAYNGKTVLHDTTISVKKGQLTSLIGPNGAGKSTLLSIMSRLIQPDSGAAYLEDKPYSAYPPQELAKKMSILKQANHMVLSGVIGKRSGKVLIKSPVMLSTSFKSAGRPDTVTPNTTSSEPE